MQANSIADAMVGAFGVPKLVTGLALAALTAIVIFGGIRKIATVAEYVVPFMAGGLPAGGALRAGHQHLPRCRPCSATSSATPSASPEAAGGVAGGVAAAMLNGVKRGLFSNEAGMGSAPNIAAAATPVPHHPSSQGFVQALGVFIDTIVICSCTALMILLSGVYVPGGELTGTAADPVGAGRAHRLRSGTYFIAIAIFFFAFTSIIGNYSYSEMAMVYLGVGNTTGLLALRVDRAGDGGLGRAAGGGDGVQHRRRLDGADGDDQPDRDRRAVRARW